MKPESPELIQKYIAEFISLSQRRSDKTLTARYYKAGTRLNDIRDRVSDRLDVGYHYLIDHPDDEKADALWFELLEKYEILCDVLHASEERADVIEAAEAIFDGVSYGEDRRTGGGTTRPVATQARL